MSDIMRPRYGTKAENDVYIGLDGEISIDRETQHLRIHDGVTAGGAKVVANQDEVEAVRTTAESAQATAEAALPKSGGTLTGHLSFNTKTAYIQKTGTDQKLVIRGGTEWNTGGQIELNGKDNGNGDITIRATNGTSASMLWLGGDGGITHNGNNVITSAGGTMTGDIATNGVVRRNVNNDYNAFLAGADWSNTGGYLHVYGPNHPTDAGVAILGASAGGVWKALRLSPDGSMTWDFKEVERVNSSGVDWIRYESGLQIVWGRANLPSSSKNGMITIPASFLDAEHYRVLTTYTDVDNQRSYVVSSSPVSGASFKMMGINGIDGAYSWDRSHDFIAIGKWK